MANNIYIGNRYVPVFANPVEWDNLREYEPLTIVTYQGTSYTSKKRVPVGTALSNTEYWVVTGNYNAQVEEYRQAVVDLNGVVAGNYNTRRKRNFIIIGDSFGAGVVSAGQPLTTGWIKAFKQMWQDNGHGKVYYNIQPLPGVAGFASSLPFLNILTQDIETQISDFNEITDIVVLGGTNDQSQTSAAVRSAVATFCNHCKVNFPYARVAIGVYGSNKVGLKDHVYNDYAYCINYGAEFISDLFNLICEPQYISDGTHLTVEGYAFYNPYVCQAIITGRSHYNFKLGYAPDSEDGPTLRFVITEDSVKACITKYNLPDPFSMVLETPLEAIINLGHYSALPFVYWKPTDRPYFGTVYCNDDGNWFAGGSGQISLEYQTLKFRPVMLPHNRTSGYILIVDEDWFDVTKVGFN